jgi:ABC-type amino acid transport substrate-binding protein
MFKIIRSSLLLLLYPSLLFGGQTLTFVQISDIPSQTVAAEMLRVAYSKIGISIKTIEYPGKRALQESSQGRVDGEVFRIHKIGEIYSSLIRVPTPFYTDNAVAFGNGNSFKINSCDDLKSYSVSIIRGVKYAEICTKGVEKLVIANNNETMLKMLNKDRIDLVLTTKANGLMIAKKLNLTSIKPISPSLKRLVLYHYLHKKNSHLVPKIDKVLQEMTKSGELERIKKRAFSKL